MAGATSEYTIAADGCFTAPLVLSYPYGRTLGATYGRFFTGLRDRQIEGTRGADGAVYVPPIEFDPVTGAACTEWVTVGSEGTVTTWSWQPSPVEGNPLDHPFAWALIRLDGAGHGFLHAVDAGSADNMETGMRVRVRWAAERGTGITDIVCFDPVAVEARPVDELPVDELPIVDEMPVDDELDDAA